MLHFRYKFAVYLCLAALSAFGQAKKEPPKDAPPPPPPPAGIMAQTEAPKAPPKPVYEHIRESSDGQFSIAIYYWLNQSDLKIRDGHARVTGASTSNLDMPQQHPLTGSVIVNAPAGAKADTLHFQYSRAQGRGDTKAPSDLDIFSTFYTKGNFLSTKYVVQHGKVTWDIVSLPNPLNDTSLRVKTLVEAQYLSVNHRIDAPIVAAADNTVQTLAQKSTWFVYPALGMGLEKLITKNLRWELKGTGFAIPKHCTIWDAESLLAFRAGPVEIFGGGRVLHFKTSPKKEEYTRGLMDGVFVGLRWYP